MGIDVMQYRERVGRFYIASITVKKSKRLYLLELYCVYLFVKLGLKAMPVAVFLFANRFCLSIDNATIYNSCCNRQSQKSSTSSKFLEVVDHATYFFIVLCILLIISGIEMNPGPTFSDTNTTSSSITSISSDLSANYYNSFSFLHLNIQSIVPKLDNITAEYSVHEILSFTESWLKPHISDDVLKIPGYSPPFRRDRIDRMGGGVIVYVKENVNCILRPDLQVGNIECLWLEVRVKNKKYLYGTFYIPPNSNLQIWDDLEISIDRALNTNYSCDIIVTGDFNVNMGSNNSSRIDNLLTQFSLHQLITDPTYITEHSSSLLDLIIVSNPNCILYSDVGPPLLDQTRYHLPVTGILNQPYNSTESFKRKIYLFDRGDYDMYRQKLLEVDWDGLVSGDDIDVMVTNFANEISKAADIAIPNRCIIVRKSTPPWLTCRIKRCIRRKNRLHKRAKKSNLPGHWATFRIARNKCNNLIANAKNKYFADMSEKICSETMGSKGWWNLVKNLVGNSENRCIPPIESEGRLVFDDTEKAELFNNFFL